MPQTIHLCGNMKQKSKIDKLHLPHSFMYNIFLCSYHFDVQIGVFNHFSGRLKAAYLNLMVFRALITDQILNCNNNYLHAGFKENANENGN